MPARKAPVPVSISAAVPLRAPREQISRLVRFVLARQHAHADDVDLAFVSPRRMASLNRAWVGHSGATDVISFDLADPGEPLCAQLILCPDVAAREAAARRLPYRRELYLYIVHGLLHLTGHDDTTPPLAAAMSSRQEELLEMFLAAERKRG